MKDSYYHKPSSTSEQFNRFMQGFSAAMQLYARSGKNGFAIEHICLAATIIDATLRIGLILQHQIETKSDSVLASMLFQGKDDARLSERDIYKQALSKKVIDTDIYKTLCELFDNRNRVIHRYIISEITTDEIIQIGIRFEDIVGKVKICVRALENRQIELGVGMTRIEKTSEKGHKTLISEIEQMAHKKHGNPHLAKTLEKEANLENADEGEK